MYPGKESHLSIIEPKGGIRHALTSILVVSLYSSSKEKYQSPKAKCPSSCNFKLKLCYQTNRHRLYTVPVNASSLIPIANNPEISSSIIHSTGWVIYTGTAQLRSISTNICLSNLALMPTCPPPLLTQGPMMLPYH